ncbi:MAG: ribosome biogenesis GTPase Der [Bacteroidetes bacterium]|nr:ribosome biogenesis GTPase Der [Bacteroidota bacterium]MBL0019091.1 ribosome biogenesis GTPase Der [Bacteroidota bacterium]
MSGIVAIIGRPNVGKSTLFNRMIAAREAIVDDQSGVTRDRHYGISEWNGVKFTVIDTGGYVPLSDDLFEKAIREQVHIAMEEADILLFVVDALVGVVTLDMEFGNIVRRSKKPVFLVANKADNFERSDLVYEFYELALGEVFSVSALNGAGTGDLMDSIVNALPQDKPEPTVADVPKFAFVGRPNVGKSSLVNALLGKEQNIVTPISGTTRDSIYTRYTAFGLDLYMIDTAGLRRKARVHENIEFYSTLRSIKAIEECDVAILLIDATLGIEAQDLHILGDITENSKGVVIFVNKWDLVEKETNTARDFEALIQERIAPLSNVPVVFGSALEKQRILRALEIAVEVYHEKQKKVGTAELNEVMQLAWNNHKPAAVRGKIIRIKYVTQIPAPIPTFLFFCNHPKLIQENYKRYLENQIRDNFGFKGVPLNVFFRQK